MTRWPRVGRWALGAGLAAACLACGGDDVTVADLDRSAAVASTGSTTTTTTTTTTAPTPTTEPTTTVAVRLDRRVDDEATAGFADDVLATLTDPRGWERAGFRFVVTDDAPNAIVLAEGAEVDELCRPYDTGGRFSCQIGPVVALNADRWRTATESWPGTLTEYRQMLVNHEVGHLLGRHHARPDCPATGPLAAVMVQQSSTLGDCAHNPWPLDWEIACVAIDPEPFAPPHEPDATAECGPAGLR